MSQQFNFKYTAPSQEERKEIDSIRRQYSPQDKTENKLERLRRLNNLVKNTAVAYSLILGILGILIFGLGLAMILEWNILFWGIALMVVACVPMAFSYPVYKKIFNAGKEKYGDEILRLSEELLNEKEN